MTTKIIIIGAGGHARVLKDILNKLPQIEIIGFSALEPGEEKGIRYLAGDKAIEEYSKKDVFLVNGIGSVELPTKRQKIYEKFKDLGYSFYSVIHPNAIISQDVDLAEGIQIMAGAVINTGAVIEENVIINTSATVEHGCRIGAHSHIAPGVTFSGDVIVGKNCHIGTGAVIIQGRRIGDHVFVGAGSVVIDNIFSRTTAFGVPAKIYNSVDFKRNN